MRLSARSGRPTSLTRDRNCRLLAARFMMIPMDNGFIEISDIPALDDFLTKRSGSAVVLFKHSETCGVSARAYRELSRLPGPVGLITVQRARPVSDEIERRWELEHETPQVLIVRDGKLVWTASHFRVRAEDVEKAINGEGRGPTLNG